MIKKISAKRPESIVKHISNKVSNNYKCSCRKIGIRTLYFIRLKGTVVNRTRYSTNITPTVPLIEAFNRIINHELNYESIFVISVSL